MCAEARTAGMKVGVALKPGTSSEAVFPLCDDAAAKPDMVLVMTVEPGFGGQKFQPEMMPKVRALRERYPDLDIQVDGGLAAEHDYAAAESGANVIVAGERRLRRARPGGGDPSATTSGGRTRVGAHGITRGDARRRYMR